MHDYKVKATWDTSTNTALVKDITRMLMEEMVRGKDKEIAKVFNDLKCTSGAISDPLFDLAIDVFLEEKKKNEQKG